jgi:predicted Zn-dependent protease
MLRGVPIAIALCVGCGHAPPPDDRPDPSSDVDAQTLFETGKALLARNDLIRAEQYFTAAAARGWDPRETTPLIVEACIRSNRFSSALSHAEPYLAQHPDDWRLRLVVATIELGMGRPGAAEEHVRAVAESQPEEPLAHFLLGTIALEHRGDDDAARTHLAHYLSLAPQGEHAEAARSALQRVAQETGRTTVLGTGDEEEPAAPTPVEPVESE